MYCLKSSWNIYQKSNKNSPKLIIDRTSYVKSNQSKGINYVNNANQSSFLFNSSNTQNNNKNTNINSFLSPVQKLGQKRSLSTSVLVNGNKGNNHITIDTFVNNREKDYTNKSKNIDSMFSFKDRCNNNDSISNNIKYNKNPQQQYFSTHYLKKSYSTTHCNSQNNNDLSRSRLINQNNFSQTKNSFRNLNNINSFQQYIKKARQSQQNTLHKNGKNAFEMKSQFKQNMQNLNVLDQARKKYQKEIQELKAHLRSSQEQNLKLIAKRDQDLQLISKQNQEILMLQHELKTIQKCYEQQKAQFIYCKCQKQQFLRDEKQRQINIDKQRLKLLQDCKQFQNQAQKYKRLVENYQKVLNQKKRQFQQREKFKQNIKTQLNDLNLDKNFQAKTMINNINKIQNRMSTNNQNENYQDKYSIIKEEQQFKIAFLLNQINQYRNKQIDKIDCLLNF